MFCPKKGLSAKAMNTRKRCLYEQHCQDSHPLCSGCHTVRMVSTRHTNLRLTKNYLAAAAKRTIYELRTQEGIYRLHHGVSEQGFHTGRCVAAV